MHSRRIRVLLVGFSPDDCRMVHKRLAKSSIARFRVECSDTLVLGLDRLSRGGIDAILLSISPPDRHWLDTCADVLQAAAERPVIVMTNRDFETTALTAVRLGVQDYLIKGQVDYRTLQRSICCAVERQNAALRYSKGLGTPFWDTQLRELSVGSVLIKRFRQPSPNQEIVLAAFQEQRWPHRIDDPMRPAPELDPKARLQTTIKSLNRRQRNRLIRFQGDGTGMGVLWEYSFDGPTEIGTFREWAHSSPASGE